MKGWIAAGIRVMAPIALAFILGFILFAGAGYDIAEVLNGLWQGAIAAPGSLEQSIRWAIPLALISFGIVITLRAGEFNIGAQGQILLGGLGAASVALLLPDWPPWLVIPLGAARGIDRRRLVVGDRRRPQGLLPG